MFQMKLSTTDKKSFIIGMLLGDACTRLGKNAINYNISCTHNPSQYEYLLWKMEILKENKLQFDLLCYNLPLMLYLNKRIHK